MSRAAVLVVDTSVVVNFAKAGALVVLAEYLGDRALITQDVFGELTDWTKTHPSIGRLLAQPPWSRPVDLSPEQSQRVIDILGFVRAADTGELQDVGEVSCVILAQDLRDSQGLQPVLVLDDIRHGKNLARLRGLEVVDTPGLIIEMVQAGVLSKALGGKVWRATLARPKWTSYETRLAGAEE